MTDEEILRRAASILGKRGGKVAFGEAKAKGARAMHATLTDEQRSENARKASKARWSKAKKKR